MSDEIQTPDVTTPTVDTPMNEAEAPTTTAEPPSTEPPTAAAEIPTAETPVADAEPLPTFTAPRRRNLAKFRRRKSLSASPEPDTKPSTTDAAAESTTAETSQQSALQRPRRPARRLGLEVSAPKTLPTSEAPSDPDSEARQAELEALAVVNRFTHQTGQIENVDKHMMAYVEFEMLKRRGEPLPTRSSPTDDDSAGGREGGSGGQGSYWVPTRPEARGATLGKLHEVDLGQEARERNIALTAAALNGEPLPSSSDPSATSNSKRSRKRRSSQDVERDRLVEEVLKETRLDLYPEESEQGESEEEEGAADDKIAEKFRREFLDAILSKRRRRGQDSKAGAKTGAGKKEDKKRPKGPKLGGSRMARAQMREQQGGAAGQGKR
ncbi:hypothetical protein FPQ18DRAFT_332656 [Pyronema domesticum]|uniref:Hepatocellular carcinoma-associated antigen 59-domain-containing protein n=1 Tax=Pyronema omphalodes (strain CBS 100304) TaxID=1076935 RepID=U4LQZ2_PYROM|nr:hypothetical protein FPQ18DRAFT_332656 [Pyronema domesticum]CCX34345.1 Similar to hypothetical protein AOL_s00109g148 [Arthrobotrys oligospora ATCC 24927]; acc. no. EGX46390 [Pyronema omphalodes CBS 100304]